MKPQDIDNVIKPDKSDYHEGQKDQYIEDLERYALYKSKESEMLKKAYIELYQNSAWVLKTNKDVYDYHEELSDILIKEKIL